MVSYRLLRDDGILIVSPQGPLMSTDFEAITKDVDEYIEENGSLAGLVIKTQSFPGWKDFEALIAHFKFVHEHHKKIKKVAAVTDDKFLSIMPLVVQYFVKAEVRHFRQNEEQAALEWIRSL